MFSTIPNWLTLNITCRFYEKYLDFREKFKYEMRLLLLLLLLYSSFIISFKNFIMKSTKKNSEQISTEGTCRWIQCIAKTFNAKVSDGSLTKIVMLLPITRLLYLIFIEPKALLNYYDYYHSQAFSIVIVKR